MRRWVWLVFLTSCGRVDIAGTYVVTPVLSLDTCNGNCPKPNTVAYKITKTTDKAYTIDANGSDVIATYAEGPGTLDWETTESDATSGCTEHDTGHVTVKAGKLDGFLNVDFSCSTGTCGCAYNLTGAS